MDTIVALADLISALGGPSISHPDLTRVADMPAGHALVHWMISQAQDPVQKQEGTQISITALKQVALEREELELKKNIGDISYETLDILTEHATPSSLRNRVKHIRIECELSENQSQVLRARLRQTKISMQQVKKTAKTLQSLIDHAGAETQSVTRRLQDLAVSSDTTTNKVASSVPPLLELLSAYSDSASSLFEQLSTCYDSILSVSEKIRAEMDVMEDLSTSQEEVKEEATRLRRVLAPLQHRSQPLLDHSYREELLDICQRIESGDFLQADLEKLLEGIHVKCGEDTNAIEVDIKAEVEGAWMLDRLELLRSRSDLAEQVQSLIDTRLAHQMQGLHKDITCRTERTFETECLVNALLEELEEIADDVQNARNRSPKGNDTMLKAVGLLEKDLVDTVKQLQDRKPAMEPPLVLLDRADLECELTVVQRRLDQSKSQEEQWLSSLTSQLSSLSQRQKLLLSAIYEHAPLNTCPPFSLPPALKQLEDEARNRAESMSDTIVQLGKDVEVSKHTRKKLNGFIEKWGK